MLMDCYPADHECLKFSRDPDICLGTSDLGKISFVIMGSHILCYTLLISKPPEEFCFACFLLNLFR